MNRILTLAVFLLAVAVAWPTPARADDKERILLLAFVGPSSSRVRREAQRALKKRAKDFEIITTNAARRVAEAFGKPIESAEVAEKLGVVAQVKGFTRKRRNKLTLIVEVLRPSDGETIGRVELTGSNRSKLNRQIRDKLWAEIEPHVMTAKAGAEQPDPEPEPDAEPIAELDDVPAVTAPPPAPSASAATDTSKATTTLEPNTPRPTGLLLGAGPAMINRQLYYTDDIFGAFRNYRLPLGAAVRVDLAAYPGAFVTRGIGAHFGLVGRAEFTAPLTSETNDGTKFPTSALHVMGGVDARLPLGALELGATAGLGIQQFAINNADDGTTKPAIPDAGYTYVEAGGRLRFDITDQFALSARGAYLLMLSAGEIREDVWFPRLSGGGIDLGGALEYAPIDIFGVKLGADVRRFFFSMNPEVGDPNVAGGAVDQYLVIHLLAHLRL